MSNPETGRPTRAAFDLICYPSEINGDRCEDEEAASELARLERERDDAVRGREKLVRLAKAAQAHQDAQDAFNTLSAEMQWGQGKWAGRKPTPDEYEHAMAEAKRCREIHGEFRAALKEAGDA